MTRFFVIFVLVIAATAMLGLAIAEQAGYVLIAYQGFRYESSLWAALALVLLLWLLVYGLRLLLRGLGVTGGMFNPWSARHRGRRAHLAAQHGQLELAEGHWRKALRDLRRAAAVDPQPLAHYLGAARAANELGEFEQSEQLLSQARQREPKAEMAIGLTQAQLQIDREAYPQALATLQTLQQIQPRHAYVLKLLQQLYVHLHDWPALCQLLPTLRKHKVLAPAELDLLERGAWSAALQQAGELGLNQGETALQPLTEQWQRLPSALRHTPELVAPYAEQLLRLGAPEQAEEVLRKTLNRDYDERLVRLYGQVRGGDPAHQLRAAESWLKQHPQDATLLLSLARLCLLNQLWGKARGYFEASLSVQRSAETYAELARLLAQLGDVPRSNQLFQEGLQLLQQQQVHQAHQPHPAYSVDQALPILPQPVRSER